MNGDSPQTRGPGPAEAGWPLGFGARFSENAVDDLWAVKGSGQLCGEELQGSKRRGERATRPRGGGPGGRRH